MKQSVTAENFNIKGFTPKFYIEKEGRTKGRQLIVSKDGEDFDYGKKVCKYLYLGYAVYAISGNQITL